MSFQNEVKLVNGMGFQVQQPILEQIQAFTNEAQEKIGLSDGDRDLLAALVLLKSCDSAITEGRRTVILEDFKVAKRICIPGIWVSLRTSLLENSHVSSVGLYASDVADLLNTGTASVFELASKSHIESALALATKIRESLPGNIPLPTQDAKIIENRMRIWQEEARLIATHLHRPALVRA